MNLGNYCTDVRKEEIMDDVGMAVGGLWPGAGQVITRSPQVSAQTSIKTSVGVQITRVRNGYFVHTPEGEFIAGSIDEITKLVAVAVAALELDR